MRHHLVNKDVLLTPLFRLDLELKDAEGINKLYYAVEAKYHKTSIKGKNKRCVLALCFQKHMKNTAPLLEEIAKLCGVNEERVGDWVGLFHKANP